MSGKEVSLMPLREGIGCDVVIDLRKALPTLLAWHGQELSFDDQRTYHLIVLGYKFTVIYIKRKFMEFVRKELPSPLRRDV